MPFFRIEDRLHYFAHVPKAGGSSVDHYLAKRFGPLAFFDSRHGDRPEPQRWTRSSPQHVCWRDLYRLVPRVWIAASFAVVRDPLARLLSAFRFQKDALRSIPPERRFDEWFLLRLPQLRRGAFFDDNHLVPQTRIVPPEATVFRLEDGLDAIVAYLDGLEGAASAPRVVEPENTGSGSGRPAVSEKVVALIAQVYAEDYARFGYPRPAPQTAIRTDGSSPRTQA